MLPVATLVYGWSLQEEVGGMALPIIAAFFGGAGLMGSYNGFNTYAAGKNSRLVTTFDSTRRNILIINLRN